MNPVPGGDRILLTGVRASGRHGVLPEERERGQEFVVDLELTLPFAVAAATDDVTATVHYGELAERVVAEVGADPVDLIETLADRIAALVLADARVERVVVTVHKPSAPIPVPFGGVAVRVERVRAAADVPVVIALGANLGDAERTLDDAVHALRRLRGLVVDRVSSSHETVAVTPQGPDPSRPRYRNQVLVGRTSLPPRELLHALLGIETVFGRVRAERWGDRTLDLDLVAMGDLRVDEPGLVLPHPRAHERGFVLRPWLEADPDAELPGRGRVRHLVAALPEEG
ncbi:2-amino-4-hydroxy-6-hydroxymethyldihydropteridine diphosphokinase [Amnibacterium endophyticum]|uniref:Bifunctional folate synthesis protein n=1 Tax=Amnibacterium endophyticum TaxID=2109337 RepID=A0ABW4LBB8_9MICO